MTQKDVTRRDIVWSYTYVLSYYAGGLAILPFTIKYLTPEEFGIWAAFLLLLGFVQLIDFGLQPAIIRHIAYADSIKDANSPSLGAYLIAIHRTYIKITCIIFFAQLIPGSLYLSYISENTTINQIVGWLVFCCGTTLSAYAQSINASLQGLQKIAEAQKSNTVARSLSLIVTLIGLIIGWGILGCAIGTALGSVAALILNKRELSKLLNNNEKLKARSVQEEDITQANRTIMQTAKKLGSASIANFLILRYNIFAASLFLPLKTFAAYSLATQVLQAAVSLSRVRFNASIPILSVAANKKDVRKFENIYKNSLRQSWFLYSLLAFGMIMLGPIVVKKINSDASTLLMHELILLVALYSLEVIHGNATMALTCFNKIPFVSAAWLTAIAIIALSSISEIALPGSIAALICAQLIAQISYNSWKWPLELRNHINSLKRENKSKAQ